MKTVPTYTAVIYVGFWEHSTTVTHALDEARAVCQQYVNDAGLCVTLTPTEYIYTNGGEPGCAIGLINYPRFPAETSTIRAHAIELGRRLLQQFRQYKVSIVFPDETVMLEQE